MKLFKMIIYRITKPLLGVFIGILFSGGTTLPIFIFSEKYRLTAAIGALAAIIFWLKREEKLGNQKFTELKRSGFSPVYNYKYYVNEIFCWRLFCINCLIVMGWIIVW